MSFSTIPEALEAFARGEFLLVLDREDRENEGDLIISGSTITQAQMAFFVKHTSGYICAPCHPSVLDALEIPPMVTTNTDRNKTAYAVTVDYAKGTTTGISAHDRALTARMLAAAAVHVQPRAPQGFAQGAQASLPAAPEQPTPESFTRPGHLVPLRYRPGGTRVRQGHTEASVDLCLATGQPPAALLCELVDSTNEHGGIAARDACLAFAKEHGLHAITIEALREWRAQQEGEKIPELNQ